MIKSDEIIETPQASPSKPSVKFTALVVPTNKKIKNGIYHTPNSILHPMTGTMKKKSKLDKFADNLFRHVVVAGELNIGKNIVLRVGYNYGLRKSMISPTKKGAVGLSYGVGINVYKFTINYSRSEMHIHGSPNYITITTNLDSFKKH